MEYILIFITGLVCGASAVLAVNRMRRSEARDIAQELISQAESRKTEDIENIIGRIKESFGALSMEALSRNTDEFLKFARESLSKQTEIGERHLEGKKGLIDQTLDAMKKDLQKVQTLMGEFEKDRENKFGELAGQLKSAAEQTGKLQETANKLHAALASSKMRGQWGERMAEDVLSLAGFIEGVNYQKQAVLEAGGTRPDYTFMLPQDMKVNMDVKFPMDNYLRYLEAEEPGREAYKKQFLKDVRARIKEVTTRDYINPGENTVDYVLVFIPNEQVYGFINESDSSMLDEALKQKVVLCSPITLYAVLAVIRQAVDNFHLEETAARILSLMGEFNKQWQEFVGGLEKVGRRIEDAGREYINITTTRRNKLEKPLLEIEELRRERNLELAETACPETVEE